ncbi:cytidylate kinase-like family protein [Candidatus Roizmanbacteria bacterium]|nr:cytidylate kinase-like family protein [Candidatus Roizmanbacteria bacterium]
MRRIFQLIDKNVFSNRLSHLFKKKEPQKELPLIIISREMGSGGRPIAYLVEKKLGTPWKVFHGEIVDQIAKETRLEKKLIKEVDETNIPFIDEIVSDFFGRRYLNLNSYYKNLVKVLSTIGNRGYAIIVGRGGEYLFPHALKVRIICEMEQRILWEMEFEKLTRQQAINRIEKSDRERDDFIQTLFHHDPRKAHHYDLVIRTGQKLSIEDAAETIVFVAKRRFKI